jgi:hypothetical protein
MSAQRECKKKAGKGGRPFKIANRSSDNAIALKSLFLDIDVGKAGGYATQMEAAEALSGFILATGLPKITVVVSSGSGGLHAYWVLNETLPVAAWKPLAGALVRAAQKHGLKCDTQVTIDAARILRVPETFNCKGGGKRPVELKVIRETDAPLDCVREALEPFLGPVAVVESDTLNARHGTPQPHINDELSAGIKSGATPRDIDKVAEQCSWIKDTLANGGAGSPEPVWHQALRVAAYCETPDETAHRLSSEHAEYLREETQAKFDRIAKERLEKDLGFPSCKTICDAGAPQCATCPHFALGRSPLSLPGVSRALIMPLSTAKGDLPDIPGGVYEPEQAFEEVSARFALVNRRGELSIIHRTNSGEAETISEDDFRLYLAPVRVTIGDGDKQRFVRVADWWREHPNRPPVRRAVFKPHTPEALDEYNFWRGFGVDPQQGVNKLWRLFRHTWRVLCQGDKAKFHYLIRWLAWAVQHPDKNPETVIVLKSRGEGSGKTTLGDAMRRIFGQHGTIVSDPEQIIGRHVDHLEFMSFVMIEEALFAGDPREASRVRSRITSATAPINPKHRQAYTAPNVMHAILTTNHDWAVHAGKNARRWFVCEVSESATFDAEWFKQLYRDLDTGGVGQLLNFLLNLKLGDWHPRQIVRTRELAQQQLMSANGVEQWLWACAENGHISTWLSNGQEGGALELDKGYWTSTLYKAYCGHIKHTTAGRIESQIAFGSRLKAILKESGYDRNMRENGSAKRAPGYHIPDAQALRLGIAGEIGIRLQRVN